MTIVEDDPAMVSVMTGGITLDLPSKSLFLSRDEARALAYELLRATHCLLGGKDALKVFMDKKWVGNNNGAILKSQCTCNSGCNSWSCDNM